MSVIDDVLRQMSARLEEIEREARELRAAIAAVENGRASSKRSARVRGLQTHAAVPRRSVNRTRARRGENRRTILAAIQEQAKTAREVAAETGIARDTVASTLLALVRVGKARKAARGYVAAG